jgi:hypothetical protein
MQVDPVAQVAGIVVVVLVVVEVVDVEVVVVIAHTFFLPMRTQIRGFTFPLTLEVLTAPIFRHLPPGLEASAGIGETKENKITKLNNFLTKDIPTPYMSLIGPIFTIASIKRNAAH